MGHWAGLLCFIKRTLTPLCSLLYEGIQPRFLDSKVSESFDLMFVQVQKLQGSTDGVMQGVTDNFGRLLQRSPNETAS